MEIGDVLKKSAAHPCHAVIPVPPVVSHLLPKSNWIIRIIFETARWKLTVLENTKVKCACSGKFRISSGLICAEKWAWPLISVPKWDI